MLGGEINPIVDENKVITNIDEWQIYINQDEINKVNEMDDDVLYNSYINSGRFFVVGPGKQKIEMSLNDDKEIYIAEDVLEIMKKNDGYIPFSELSDDMKVFEVIIMNKELTKSLYSLMKLLDKNADSKDDDDDSSYIGGSYASMCQKFIELLVESKIDANSIAAELLVNRLIRSVKNPYMRPDFTKKEVEPYTIFTVSRALERNKAPLIGISFENIKRQFLSDDLYTVRHYSSYIDPLYKTEVDMSNYHKYSKIVHADKSKLEEELEMIDYLDEDDEE
jgi:hypothetical protein